MAYETVYKNGVLYPECEMIIKPYVRWQVNNYKKDYTRFLVNRVALDGVRYNFTVARLVYCCFVKPIDLRDAGVVIFYKDGDSFNIVPSNLRLATISEKQKRIKELRRSPSPLHKMTPEERKKRQLLIAKKLSKQVSQYRLNGTKVKTYSSAKAASRATGINDCGIGCVARGRAITSGGFIWRYGKEELIDIRPLLKMHTLKHSPVAKALFEMKKSTLKPLSSKRPSVKVNVEKAYEVHKPHQQWKKLKKEH